MANSRIIAILNDGIVRPLEAGDYVTQGDGNDLKISLGDSSGANYLKIYDNNLPSNSIFKIDSQGEATIMRIVLPDQAGKPPLNILTAMTAVPASPVSGDIYLDAGDATVSGKLGFRRYNGTSWEDIAESVTPGNDIYNQFQTIYTPFNIPWSSDNSGGGSSSVANMVVTKVTAASSGTNTWAVAYVNIANNDNTNRTILWTTKDYDVEFLMTSQNNVASSVLWLWLGYAGVGNWNYLGPYAFRYVVGFKIVNNTVYGFVTDGLNIILSSSLGTISTGFSNTNRLRFKATAGGNVEFSLNGGSFGNGLTTPTTNETQGGIVIMAEDAVAQPSPVELLLTRTIVNKEF